MYIYFNVNNASNNSTQLHILTLYDPWSTFNVGCEESGETHCTVVNYAAKSNVLMEKKTLELRRKIEFLKKSSICLNFNLS